MNQTNQLFSKRDSNNNTDMNEKRLSGLDNGIGKLVPIQVHFEDLRFSVKVPKKKKLFKKNDDE